jgi:hypothetical protein
MFVHHRLRQMTVRVRCGSLKPGAAASSASITDMVVIAADFGTSTDPVTHEGSFGVRR